MSELDSIVNQNTLSPLARIAAAVANWGGVEGGPSLNDMYNWGGVVGAPSLHQIVTGIAGLLPQPQPPLTPQPVAPSPPTTQATPYFRGAPGTQSGFAVPAPDATATKPDIPPLPPRPVDRLPNPITTDPPPPMPKPTPDTRPDLAGQPGAKEPDPTQWGVSHSPLGDLINRAMTQLEKQQPIAPPDLKELPPPVSQQVQNSWMSTVLSSAGLLLAAFGSRRSAAPMTAAIKSFGGYLQGYNEGQQEVWKQKQAEYKEQLDYALQRNQLELDRYRVAVEAAKGDTEKMHEMLYAASILNEDERGRALIAQGRLDEFFKWTDAHQKWWDAVTAVRDFNAATGLHRPEPPEPVMPEELRGYIYGGGGGGEGGTGSAIDIAVGVESSGRWDVTGPNTDSGPSRGGLQITDGTWKQYAPPEVLRKYPRADLAPKDTQIEVGKTIPVNRWGDKTKAAWHRAFGDFDENQTLGQLQAQHPGGGTQVAGPGGGTTPRPDTSGGETPQPDTSDQTAATGSPVDTLAHSILRGGEPPSGSNKDEVEYASARYEQLAGQVAAIANNPDLKGQAVVDALRKIDPMFASTMAAVARNDEGLPAGSGFGTRLFDLRETERALAEKIKPGWKPAQYASKQDLRKQFNPEGNFGKTLYRASGLANASANVLKAINAMPKDLSVPEAVLAQINATGFTNDPKYRKLALSWLELAQEANAIATGGAPTVTTTQDLMKMFPMSAKQDGMRSMLQIILSDAAAKTGDIKRIWAANFQDEPGPTGLDPDADTAIDQILHHMDVDTGDFDTKVSPILQPAIPFDPTKPLE